MNGNIDLTVFYEFLTDKTPIGIHAINSKGQTIIYNDKMKNIEGLNLEEMVDRSILDVFRFNHSEQSTLLRVLQSEQPVLNVKQTYWNQNGQEITTINDTYPVFHEDKIVGAIEFSRDITTLEKLIHQPLQRYGEPMTFDVITAVSPQMQRVLQIAKKAAIAKLPVLLIGESGTGKDLVAEAIHYEAENSTAQFITIYCNRADDKVVERLAQQLIDLPKSTIFCERLEYLKLEQQQQLLELLESYSNEYLFIASIGNDPVNLIASELLMKDLYYFFASITIQIPPLRQRFDDMKPFIQDYLRRYRQRFNSQTKDITNEVEQLFHYYDWPGNLKELEVLLDEMTSVMSNEEYITYDMLPHHFKLKVQEYRDNTALHAEDFVIQAEQQLIPLEQYLQQAESYYLNKVLDKYGHNITKTAEALGMSRQNLQYRLRKMKKEQN
ncbi:MAG: sigma 54-interacting transcriptional regulator [Kurthia sp.]|nr:sigma 54-interacting transcriptional regulator [Candidatus Kurthia equi]